MLKTMTHRLPAFQATRGKPEGGQPMTRKFKLQLLVAAIAAVPSTSASAMASQVSSCMCRGDCCQSRSSPGWK